MAVWGELFLEAYIKPAAFLFQSVEAAQSERRDVTQAASRDVTRKQWRKKKRLKPEYESAETIS